MKFIFITLINVIYVQLAAQNLVPNPSFEQFSKCPDTYYQVTRATPWFSPNCDPLRPDAHGEAVFFNGCNTTYVSVPANNICIQSAHTGVGYVGIEVISSYFIPNYRQYIETKLLSPLVAGKKYYFSMYFNLCNFKYPETSPICFNADSTGVVFSADLFDKNPYCHPIPISPAVHPSGLKAVTPSEKWHLIDGCYTASGNENYLLAGNFGSESYSSCAVEDTIPSFIFLDDISLIAEIQKTTDTSLCPDEEWETDAATFREEYTKMTGWTYLWDNGETSPVHKFTKPGKQRLTVSRNDCFHDTYDYDVKFTNECACQLNVPNAFTPNGDAINDVFKPRISCKTVEMSNYSLSIYNRWGEKIYFTADKNAGWNGKQHGKIMSNQTFGWVIEYDIKKGNRAGHKHLSGTVLPLK